MHASKTRISGYSVVRKLPRTQGAHSLFQFASMDLTLSKVLLIQEMAHSPPEAGGRRIEDIVKRPHIVFGLCSWGEERRHQRNCIGPSWLLSLLSKAYCSQLGIIAS